MTSNKQKAVLITGACFILVFVLLCFRPVPIPEEDDCIVINGTIAEISEGGVKDVIFKLQGKKETFYINRGLERGLNMQTLRANLLDKEVTIKYPDYWTPLDINKLSVHISKLEHSGQTIFSELK